MLTDYLFNTIMPNLHPIQQLCIVITLGTLGLAILCSFSLLFDLIVERLLHHGN